MRSRNEFHKLPRPLFQLKFINRILAATCLLGFSPATAAVVTYDYSGTWLLDNPYGSSGQSFVGTVSYDTGATDSAGSSSFGQFSTGVVTLNGTSSMSSAFHTIRNFSADYYSFSFSLGSGTIGGKLNDSSGSRFTSDSDTDTLPGSGAAFDFSQFDSTTFSSFAGTDETVIGTIDSFHLEGIPEPSGLSLLGVAAIGLLAGRSRVRRTAMGG